jgi:hypothetical protein
MTTRPAIFKGRQTEPQLILCAVRWYLRYSLSLRDVEELLEERCLSWIPKLSWVTGAQVSDKNGGWKNMLGIVVSHEKGWFCYRTSG